MPTLFSYTHHSLDKVPYFSYTPSPHCLLSSLIFSPIFSHILIDIWPRERDTTIREFEEEKGAWRKKACSRERKYLSATYFSSSCIIVSFC
ncbi:hypothetical protein LguiA_033020 [Lonicera macranthoides]